MSKLLTVIFGLMLNAVIATTSEVAIGKIYTHSLTTTTENSIDDDGTDDTDQDCKSLADAYIMQGDSISTCDSLTLDAFLIPKKEIFGENFDQQPDNTKWDSISGGIPSVTCGSVANDAFYLNGSDNRVLETINIDTDKGGVLTFYVKAGFCDRCICDRPENDEEDENLYLEYSIDNGVTWDTIMLFDSDIYGTKDTFDYIVVDIPDDAQTSATKFRWIQYQYNHLQDKDVWVIDEISIREGLGEYSIKWTPSNTVSNDTIASPVIFPNETTMYYVEFTDKTTGCVFEDSIKVIFTSEFTSQTYSEFTYCPNSPPLEIKATNAGDIYTYTWYPNTIQDPTSSNPKVAPTTSTLYTVVITNPVTNCYRREEVYVSVPPNFNVGIMQDSSLCKGQKLQLTSTVSPSGNYDYLWIPGLGVSDPTKSNPVVNPQKDTQYILFVQDLSTKCNKSDTINLKVYPDFKVITSGDKVLCPEAESVEISAIAGPGTNYEYQWLSGTDITDPGLSTQSVKPSSDEMYYVLSHQIGGCWKKDSIKVELYKGNLDLHVCNDTIINEEDQAFLYASGAPNYLWKNKDMLIDTLSSVYVAPVTNTMYTVIGYDDCYADTLKVTVRVSPIELFIPNLITPNDDDKNDNFRITNFGKRWNLEIYNRYGDLVYKKDKYINEWDGSGLAEGVYYYLITDIRNGQKYQGWVQVTR